MSVSVAAYSIDEARSPAPPETVLHDSADVLRLQPGPTGNRVLTLRSDSDQASGIDLVSK